MKSQTIAQPLILAVIGLGAFFTALDQTVVVTGIPEIMLDLKIPFTDLNQVSWVVTAYLLGYIAAMPLMARLADVYGYPRVYQSALLVFCAGSVLVALSPNLEWMVAARIVQAIGGGATIPIGLAIASTVIQGPQRGLALGIVIAMAEAGAMLGPAYGGTIIELLTWRWIFWLNVPQAAMLIVALAWFSNHRRKELRVDYVGGALLTVTIVALSLALSRAELFTLSSPAPFIIGAIGLTFAIALILVERRIWQPLLDPLFFRSWSFMTANLAQMLEGAALIIAMVTVPLMANTVMGKDPLTGAWWLLRMTLAVPIGAVVGGYILRIIGIRPVTIVGLSLAALGLFLVSSWELDIAEPWLTLNLVMIGVGFGLNNTPIMTRALNSVALEHQATGASLVTVARMLGMAVGIAALSSWGVTHFQVLTVGIELPVQEVGETSESIMNRMENYTAALNDASLSLFNYFFRVAGVIALVAVVPAALMRPDRRQRYWAGQPPEG